MSTDLDPLLKRRHLANVDELDFSYESSLRLTTVGSLLSPDFVTDGRSVIIEGKPGRGKTHLAIAIRVPRIAARLRCADPTTAAQLIEELSASSRDGKLHDALTPYVKPHVLVVDEAGYLAYGDDAPNVLYHVVRSGTPAPPRRALDGTKHLPDAGPPREHLSRDDDEHRAASGARPRALCRSRARHSRDAGSGRGHCAARSHCRPARLTTVSTTIPHLPSAQRPARSLPRSNRSSRGAATPIPAGDTVGRRSSVTSSLTASALGPKVSVGNIDGPRAQRKGFAIVRF